jgi:phage tail sheath protein FI
MLQYTYPGVYTREIPSGVRTVSGAPTSVALFVGPTRTGIDNRPIRLLNFSDFERAFGGLSQKSNLSYSVLHFFANGGGEAYVIRVPAKDAVAAASSFKRDVGAGGESLSVTALSSGVASNDLFVEFDDFGIGADPFGAGVDTKRFNMLVIDRLTGRVERFGNLSTSSTSSRFAPNVVNDEATGSRLVEVAVVNVDKEAPQASGSIYAVGTPPAAGAAFGSDVKLNLSVDVVKADGTADAAASLSDLSVIVFPSGSPRPTSVLEVVNKMATAINAAIRADAAAKAKMEGVGIVADFFVEGSPAVTYIRLRTDQPTDAPTSKRLADATVTISDPASSTKFLTTYGLTPSVTNPSRYQLGATYVAGSQVFGTPVAGVDGDVTGQPDSDVFKQAIMDLDGPDPFFNILCLPDIVRPAAADPLALRHANAMTVYAEAARICKNKFAFLLIDPFPNVTDVGAAESWKSTEFTFQSNHSAAYFPKIRVDDPLEPGEIRSHAPSGAIAGVIARTDGQFGVWRAPAGTEAVLTGVYGPSVRLSDEEQGILNPLGLNCIRQFPIFQTVSFGSRTVDGSDALASDWKYIPVRRTANYILRSLSEALKWAVHAPNGEELWSQIRINVTAFMHGLFRQGAFKGVSAREAYFVMCDASTTTQDDINKGVVNIVIGFAPLKPAEFVVISLRQIIQPLV